MGLTVQDKLTVKDIMNTDVLIASVDWSLDQLTEFLVDNQISGAPVINEDGKLIGVVSITDIVRYGDLGVHESRPDNPHEYYLHSQYAREEFASLQIKTETMITVREIMTPIIFEISEETPLSEVADTMIKGHIHRVLVTRNKKMVGIVTALDMLKVVRDL